ERRRRIHLVEKSARQVIVVTGASSGIGAATAIGLARSGVWILLVGRRAAELEEVRTAILATGGEASCCAADITSASDRECVMAAALARSGRIDVLVNCAGVGQRGAIEMVPMERVRECFEVNVFAAVALIQRMSAVMRAQRSGRILNISSVSGRIAQPFSAVYDASKHALEALSDGLREELAPFGVQVIVIQPGYTLSGFSATTDERDPASGAYDAAMQAFRRRDCRRRFAVRPEHVADIVVAAVHSASPKPRYAVPRVVTFIFLLRRICTDRIFYRLMLGRIQQSAEGR
ncbi:MAG: SDR family NAD(P)-dependent oxidoreductase, partial [Acidobacteriota bacterium]